MKVVTHLRIGNQICPIDERGRRIGAIERFPSISAAKRRSRELQTGYRDANGVMHKGEVRLADKVPNAAPGVA